MTNVDQVLGKLHDEADASKLEGMARYGISTENRLGIAIPSLRAMAKEIGVDHSLALELWDTGIDEAMILASMIDSLEELRDAQMEAWVMDFRSWDVCDQVCMNLFDRSPLAWVKIHQWAEREEEFVKRAAFALIASLAVHDKSAADDRFIELLPVICSGAVDDRNYVKKAVSWALRNIGKRSSVLNAAALQTARELEQMEASPAKWIARDAVRELQSEAVQQRLSTREAKNTSHS